MRGPLERIRRRVNAPDERPALTNPADAPTTVAASADDRTPVPSPAEGQPRGSDVPAGLDPGALERQEGVRRRGRARRRLRFLQRARELLLRDLGGLVFEIHRSREVGRHDHLITGKVQRLLQVDAEARELATALGRPRSDVVLRTPGLGGTCPRCGELHGSEARFCSHCGLAVADGYEAARTGEREAAHGAGHVGVRSGDPPVGSDLGRGGGSLFARRADAPAGPAQRQEPGAGGAAAEQETTAARRAAAPAGRAAPPAQAATAGRAAPPDQAADAGSRNENEHPAGARPAGDAAAGGEPARGAEPPPQTTGPNGGPGGTEDTEVIPAEARRP